MIDAFELALLPPDVTVETLAVTLRQDDSVIKRRHAARILGYFGAAAKEAVPALIEALRDENLYVRQESADTLGKIGPAAQAAVPALQKTLKDPALGYEAKKALKIINGE